LPRDVVVISRPYDGKLKLAKSFHNLGSRILRPGRSRAAFARSRYGSEFAFAKAFNREYGIAPRGYRRRSRRHLACEQSSVLWALAPLASATMHVNPAATGGGQNFSYR
jgi:hypothetical protein